MAVDWPALWHCCAQKARANIGIGDYYTHAPIAVAVDHKFTEQRSMLVHSDKVHLSLISIVHK